MPEPLSLVKDTCPIYHLVSGSIC